MGKVLVSDLTPGVPDQAQLETAVKTIVVYQIQNHVDDPTPHPVYDNIAAGRWVVLLQNGIA